MKRDADRHRCHGDESAGHTLDGKSLRQIGIAGGGPYGSTYIDRAFMLLLEDTFSKEALDEFMDLDHGSFYEDAGLILDAAAKSGSVDPDGASRNQLI